MDGIERALAGPPKVPVAVALGSNLGDRELTLTTAAAALGALLHNVRVSTFHDTAPVGVGAQPRFLNGALIGTTDLGPGALLAALLEIEGRHGRRRPHPGAPRTLDLDLILYGDIVVEGPGITVPHPRFRERAFVLAPLAEIAPDWRDPATGRTVLELLLALTAR